MKSTEARDELFGMLQTAWNAVDWSTFFPTDSYTPKIYWQGIDYPEAPPPGLAYIRAFVVNTSGRQVSFGEIGNRLFDYTGLVLVHCFGPSSSGKGLTIAEGLATIAKEAYEGRSSSGGIWFRNCQVNEIGSENGFYQVNAQAGFTYNEVK